MLVVCNGGLLNNNMNFNIEETVQSRFIRFFSNKDNAQCKQMIDFELVNLFTSNILESIIRDVGSKNQILNESNLVISPIKTEGFEDYMVSHKLDLIANKLNSLNDLYYLRVLAPSVNTDFIKFNRCIKLMINYLASLPEG